MLRHLRIPGLFAVILAQQACAPEPGEISRDSTPFDAIAESAEVTLVGNEPFWRMEITPSAQNYAATYSTPETIDGIAFSLTRFAGNNGLGFTGKLEDKPVQIALTPGDCDDTMSDASYPYTATVKLGEETLYGCAYTSDQPFTGGEAP